MDALYPLLAALGLVLVHLFAGKLRFLSYIPRHWWLSFAGGVAVAFVVLQILPTLARDQAAIAEAARGLLTLFQKHVYLVTLIGLAAFYGVERSVKTSREQNRETRRHDATSDSVFWLAISLFSTMNAIIGYLLHEEERTLGQLLLFFVAFSLKFIVNDFGLHEDHKQNYERYGRWLASGAVLLGFAVGYFTYVPRTGLAFLRAFTVGGLLVNVLKEELPSERKSKFWAFALGAGLYGLILLTL